MDTVPTGAGINGCVTPAWPGPTCPGNRRNQSGDYWEITEAINLMAAIAQPTFGGAANVPAATRGHHSMWNEACFRGIILDTG
jgi:hypothetical protein